MWREFQGPADPSPLAHRLGPEPGWWAADQPVAAQEFTYLALAEPQLQTGVRDSLIRQPRAHRQQAEDRFPPASLPPGGASTNCKRLSGRRGNVQVHRCVVHLENIERPCRFQTARHRAKLSCSHRSAVAGTRTTSDAGFAATRRRTALRLGGLRPAFQHSC